MTGREPFVMAPRALLYSDCSAEAMRLWLVLDDLCRNDTGVVLEQRDLARTIGVGYRKARYVVDELTAAGFLAVTAVPGKASRYEPLRRPRRLHATAEAIEHARRVVDNLRPTLAPAGQGGTLDPGTYGPGSPSSHNTHAREEGASGAAGRCAPTAVDNLDADGGWDPHPHHGLDVGDHLEPPTAGPVRVPWCGSCDPTTRQRDRYGENPHRCPVCHPLCAPPF